MCGIAGFIQRQPVPEGVIDRMVARIAHRGPDGHSTWVGSHNGWQIALGHTRLAIIDPRCGHQPMASEDGRLQITYNGEVYAHAQLRAMLSQRGHTFKTTSDTEAILYHLGDAGEEPAAVLASLDGMFALALWDQSRGSLLLARDRVGIKPLYYATLPGGGIAFASELSSLLEHPAIRREIDPDALASFFFMDYSMAPGCMIRGVHKLDPASFFSWSNGQTSIPKTYWSPGAVTPQVPQAFPDQLNMLRQRLDEAVQSRLIADVPVGLFLSGGLDSSVVGAIASRYAPKPFKSFTIRMEDDPEFDQSPYARLVANHIGTEHIEEPLTGTSLLDSLDIALSCLDEPLADPSIIPTYLLSRLAARHVKVVLSGDGADELWGGYPTLKAHALAAGYRAVPIALRRALIEPLVRRMPVRHGYQSLEWKAKRFVLRWDDHAPKRHLRWMSNLDLPELGTATRAVAALPRYFAPQAATRPTGDLLNDILRLDFSTYLPGAVLTKVDRASMAHGLEVRPPLLSNDLIDLAFALPSSVKARGNNVKIILKAAAADMLPQDILRRPKMGFAIPLARWLRGPLQGRLDAALESGGVWDSGLLDQNIFAHWRTEHHEMKADRSRPLWALLVLDHWWRRVMK